jgi:hypothetical protein
MAYRNILAAGIAALFLAGNAFGDNTVVSGTFDGSESSTSGLPGSCSASQQLNYQVMEQLQVSTSGTYAVKDALSFNLFEGVDINANLFQGPFNPEAWEANLITPGGIDDGEKVELNAGTAYTLVVQHYCKNLEGAWAVTFSGPGSVSSDSVVMVPVWTEGEFVNGDPVTDSDCGNSQYRESGPIRVSESGTYYYTDISIDFDVDMCLQVYSAPFDPANPTKNRLAWFEDRGIVELQENTDYYFVAQPETSAATGEFFYVLAPPAPFNIQHPMAGNWFDPPTSGQGFFLDVYDANNLMFLGWYTYDLERPDESATALIGDPGHRWLTALGPVSGNKAELEIYWASGMIFNSPTPPKQVSEQDGTITVEFFDCRFGEVTYDIWSVGEQGTIPIRRIVEDVVPMCEALTDGPGEPGLLEP